MKWSKILVLILLYTGCSIKAPEVRVTGEMTALEQEVIGTYNQMKEDTWMIASTRDEKDTTVEVSVSPEKKEVLEALQNQKFNKDDIDEFKMKEYVGEKNDGTLMIRDLKEFQLDTEKKKFIWELVTQENQDREIIMNRVIELKSTLKDSNRESILRVFSQMYQEESVKGTWIQTPDGTWKRK
ncbi:MAG: DUF1318 domain-containing protein [bacterium]